MKTKRFTTKAKPATAPKPEAAKRFKAPGKRQASLYLIRSMVGRTPSLLVEAHLEAEALKLYRQKYPAKAGESTVLNVINLTPIARESKLVLTIGRKIG